MSNDLDFINEAEANAPEATFTNYGKLDWNINRYIVWKDGQPESVTPEQYKAAPAKVNGKTAKNVELIVAVDIQEFKPDLTFTYSRRINVGDWDWNATFKPSLEKALGVKISKGTPAEGSKEITVSTALERIKGKYVAYQDVPQQKAGKDGKTYKTIKIVRVFKSKAECQAAVNERTNGAGGAASTPVESQKFNDTLVGLFKKKSAEGKSIEQIIELVGDDKDEARFGGREKYAAAIKAAIEQD